MKKIKNWFFKTCPRSGRIVGINKKNVVLKICFPLMGVNGTNLVSHSSST